MGFSRYTSGVTEQPYSIEVFYDGECPLCMREIRIMSWLDRRSRLRLTDISAAGFDAQASTGKSWDALMAEIHGRLPDGTLVVGLEVFRRMYAAVGLGFLMAPTSWPGLRAVSNAAYTRFARDRLKLTGRCSDNACALPAPGVR